MKEYFDKFRYFMGPVMAVIGGIGSFGVALAAHEFVIAAGVVVLACAAAPKVYEWCKKLMA